MQPFDSRVMGLVGKARKYHARTGKTMPSTVSDLSPLLADMRLRKSATEIESLRAACELSAEGHREAIRFARPGLFEYQVQAAMEYVWREGGSRRNGYPSIVASGRKRLHPPLRRKRSGDRGWRPGSDRRRLRNRLLLFGHHPYLSCQRSLHRTAESDLRDCAGCAAGIDCCLRPGATIRAAHETSIRIITEGLVDLGLLPLGVEDSIAMHHYREFFMHGTSHWLGLDVHDAGTYRIEGKPRVLEAAMCFTVEPGIYIDQREEIEVPRLSMTSMSGSSEPSWRVRRLARNWTR